MEQVRDLNDIIMFQGTRKVIYKDVGDVKPLTFSMDKYMFRPGYEEKLKKSLELRELADFAWEQGEKSRSTHLHAEARKIMESANDEQDS